MHVHLCRETCTPVLMHRLSHIHHTGHSASKVFPLVQNRVFRGPKRNCYPCIYVCHSRLPFFSPSPAPIKKKITHTKYLRFVDFTQHGRIPGKCLRCRPPTGSTSSFSPPLLPLPSPSGSQTKKCTCPICVSLRIVLCCLSMPSGTHLTPQTAYQSISSK